MASLITALEANPHKVELHRNDTYYEELQCQASHSPDFSKSLRKLVAKSARSDKALAKLTRQLERANPQFKAIAGTTQAVDVIRGGVKTNALPESAFVIVNHRIAGYRYAHISPELVKKTPRLTAANTRRKKKKTAPSGS